MPEPAPVRANTVLVIYETESVRRTLRGALVPEGLDVVEVSTAGEASDVLDREPVGLVVIDVQRPGPRGLELARDMRAHARMELVPIVLLTNDWRLRDGSAAAEAGVTVCLVKPTPPLIVKQTVFDLLGRPN
jgi:two-component system chemotaxis response regulator CheY